MKYSDAEITGVSVRKRQGAHKSSGATSALYGMGLIGSAVYFIQASTSFSDGLYGLLKAVVWPAIIVYKLLALFYGAA